MKIYRLSRKKKALLSLLVLAIIIVIGNISFNVFLLTPARAAKCNYERLEIFKNKGKSIIYRKENDINKLSGRVYLSDFGDKITLTYVHLKLSGWTSEVNDRAELNCKKDDKICIGCVKFVNEEYGYVWDTDDTISAYRYYYGRIKGENVEKLSFEGVSMSSVFPTQVEDKIIKNELTVTRSEHPECFKTNDGNTYFLVKYDLNRNDFNYYFSVTAYDENGKELCQTKIYEMDEMKLRKSTPID